MLHFVNSWFKHFQATCSDLFVVFSTCKCALGRLATAIQQAGGHLEDVQATLKIVIDHRQILSEMDAQNQELIEKNDNDDLEADVKDAAAVFMAKEKAMKWCQG